MKIRDPERFIMAAASVFTNPSFLATPCLNVDRSIENTIHEYAHFVTLGLRCRRGMNRNSPQIYDRVGRKLDRWPKGKQELAEIRALAVELVVLRACGALKGGYAGERLFLKYIGGTQEISNIHRRVYAHLCGPELARTERDAHRVVRRIRSHAYFKAGALRDARAHVQALQRGNADGAQKS